MAPQKKPHPDEWGWKDASATAIFAVGYNEKEFADVRLPVKQPQGSQVPVADQFEQLTPPAEKQIPRCARDDSGGGPSRLN